MKFSKFKAAATLMAIFLMIIFFTRCKSNAVAPFSGVVQGQITNTGNSMGVSGVKVYLVNAAFKVDTVNISNNKNALLDSTTTDANGKYIFTGLLEGKYAVVPVLAGSSTYIDYDKSSPDSYEFELTGLKQTFTVNFTSTYLPLDSGNFQIKIQFKNFKPLDVDWSYFVKALRYEYFLFAPVLSTTDRNSWSNFYDASIQSINFSFPYGYTSIFYTKTNKIQFTFCEMTLDASKNNVYRNSYSFEYDFTLSSCPANSTFEYDWSAHTFRRI